MVPVSVPDEVRAAAAGVPLVVVGVDSGGTWLRIKACELDGTVVKDVKMRAGRVEAGIDLVDVAATAFVVNLSEVWVLAAAGTNAIGLQDAWRAARLGGPPLLTMSEAVLACAPDTVSAVVVIAGTGSAAATVVGGRELLVTGATGMDSEKGCGVWLGRRAAAAVASGDLTGRWAQRVAADMDTRRLPPLSDGAPGYRYAALAPIVDEAAIAGDPWALATCREAASDLVTMLSAHDVDRFGGGTVLTVGSVIGRGTAVGTMFRDRLTDRMIRVEAHRADLTDPAVEWAATSLRARYHRGL